MFSDNMPIPLWLFGDYHQLCVANPHEKGWERKRSSQGRYTRGIHYTPAPIVDYLTSSILDAAFQPSPEFHPRILDPSCGCGSFLIASYRYIIEQKDDWNDPKDRERTVLSFLGQSLFGCDVDSRAIDWSIRLLYLEAKRQIGHIQHEIDPTLIPDLSDHFLVRSFFDINPDSFHTKINTILGGPPFVRYSELKKSQPETIRNLKSRFQSAEPGQFDLYMPFIEHAINLLDDGDLIGFSLSNSFLHTETGKTICQVILDRCSPVEILEFSGSSIYPDANVQIALVQLALGRQVKMGKHVLLESTPNIRIPLEQIYLTGELSIEQGRITEIPKNRLISDQMSRFVSSLTRKNSEIRLGDLPVDIFGGAASKSDEVFMLKDKGVGIQGIRHGLTRKQKKDVQCENALSVPIIRGREIKGFQYTSARHFYLAPYFDGKLISPDLLERKYPLTYRYLEQNKGMTVSSDETWYAYYTPPQYRIGKTIVACKIASPRSFALMELETQTIHGSAFGIAINDPSIDPFLLTLYLNSNLFWQRIEASMPPMGESRRSIRLSILRELTIPIQIAFPSGQNIIAAQELYKRIVQSLWRKKRGKVVEMMMEFDHFIEKTISE